MGKIHDRISDRLRKFIEAQPVYFVGTAPERGGHVNISPKGYADTFAVLDETTVAYLDLDGSGVETISHLRQNGRITLMFCAFSGSPNILRLYGTGRVVVPADPDFALLIKNFGPHPGVRSIIVVDCDRISDSCGFSVPFMSYEQDRTLLDEWAERKDVQQRRAYRAKNNRESIDGLPGLSAEETDPTSQHS
ncbi:putative pyridoxine 5'-phosphate oxidase superfamily flavin-nucleotide-binding protein [Streptosporangium becharense]|uniref:Putative pyridoxine 5'-phosphate oxidase superfamily flavin-nucleotide-binding protein n=1 Tax=Streptosporangium becharense TaxID=1816182 RepID=A0A7W9IFZ9_9ACTN|nr:pyridoxamine 5'-phosphate oxidase family protein [Streptosporangium becharense]MBB2909140.1 putative pyridoxine 5'-phosphate oxidase superfamily flavin-nucleotide-binding protein [Streptosporangium becharense]MBB5819841.1 putative pyridoxine 5'-phosphate oxidase superfamily flavin-nucleotide-binding protein [Streptosporangium becharense]